MAEKFVAESMAQLLKERMKSNYDGCLKASEILLSRTGHIPIVTSVSMGVGYCGYYAKLTEFIGVKSWLNYSVDRFSGKGKKVHEVLGLASLEIFPKAVDLNEAYKIIERVTIREVENELERENCLVSAKAIMKNLLENLDSLCSIIGSKKEELFPVVEQQFVDYEIHMRGIPDLILEDSKNKKALVIDWKTYPKGNTKPLRIYNNEYAQVVAYSLLEGQRLRKDNIREGITGEGDHVDILPVVIRADEHGPDSPHPILKKDKGEKSANRYQKMISDVLLEAEYLTILLANAIKSKESPDLIEVCKAPVEWNTSLQNMLTLIPDQMYKGVPRRQENPPCVFEGGYHCPVLKSCHFYYGREFGRKEDYEFDMWLLRYNTLAKKESSLFPYRAIYDIFKLYSSPALGSVYDWMAKGHGFEYSLGGMPHRIERPQIIQVDGDGATSRLEVLERIDFEDDDEDIMITGRRLIRQNEKEVYFVVPSGKTVLLTILDSWSPFLSLGVFANIRDVREEDGAIVYDISVPSKVFRFQMKIFKKYKTRMGQSAKFIMFEVGADLTQIELSAIDALQELLANPENSPTYTEMKLLGKERAEINEELEYIQSKEEDGVDDDRENATVLMDIFKGYAINSSRRK